MSFSSTDFTLADILIHQKEVEDFLVQNLSLSSDMAGAVLNATINGKEVSTNVYRLAFLFLPWDTQGQSGYLYIYTEDIAGQHKDISYIFAW